MMYPLILRFFKMKIRFPAVPSVPSILVRRICPSGLSSPLVPVGYGTNIWPIWFLIAAEHPFLSMATMLLWEPHFLTELPNNSHTEQNCSASHRFSAHLLPSVCRYICRRLNIALFLASCFSSAVPSLICVGSARVSDARFLLQSNLSACRKNPMLMSSYPSYCPHSTWICAFSKCIVQYSCSPFYLVCNCLYKDCVGC